MLDLANTASLLVALTSLIALYFNRQQLQLFKRQVRLAETEINDRVSSLREVVRGLEEERAHREAGFKRLQDQQRDYAQLRVQIDSRFEDIHQALLQALALAQMFTVGHLVSGVEAQDTDNTRGEVLQTALALPTAVHLAVESLKRMSKADDFTGKKALVTEFYRILNEIPQIAAKLPGVTVTDGT